jgi:hypothetical protein
MSESINANKSAKQFIVLDTISRTIKDTYKIYKIVRVMKMNIAEAELFKMTQYFRDRYLSNKRRVFMSKELSAHSSAFNLSGNGRMGDLEI